MRCLLLCCLVLVAAYAVPLPKSYESEDAARKAAEAELAKLGEAEDSSPALTAAAEKEAIAYAKVAEADPMHDGMTGLKVDLGQMEDPAEQKGEVEQAAVSEPAEAIKADTANEQVVAQSAAEEVPVVKHIKQEDERALKKKIIAEAKTKEAERVKREREESADGHLIAEGDAQVMESSTLSPKGSRPSAPQFGGLGAPFGMQGMQGPALQSPDLAGSNFNTQNPNQMMNMFGMPQIPSNMFNQPMPQMGQMMGQMPSLPQMMQQMQQSLGLAQPQQQQPFQMSQMPQMNTASPPSFPMNMGFGGAMPDLSQAMGFAQPQQFQGFNQPQQLQGFPQQAFQPQGFQQPQMMMQNPFQMPQMPQMQ